MAKPKMPNARIKRAYIDFLRHTLGRHEASLEAIAAAIDRFEDYSKHRDFKLFHIEQAKAFKAHLAQATNFRTGVPLSAATITSTLTALRNFFRWLAVQPGYRSKLSTSDADYFSAPTNLTRIATARRDRPCPTVEQIRAVLARMPAETDVEKRDRALVAFTLLTGARDGAIIGFKLKHVDIAAGRLDHDARDVATKRAKTFTSFFFPVGDDVRAIVAQWVEFLRQERLWGNGDPLFPATAVGLGPDRRFGATGISRMHWATATPIRKIFRDAFAAAELPYANPHSFRNTLVQLAYRADLSTEAMKAWSQNLGHDGMMTTLTSYGQLPVHRQGEILRGLDCGRDWQRGGVGSDVETLLRLMLAKLSVQPNREPAEG